MHPSQVHNRVFWVDFCDRLRGLNYFFEGRTGFGIFLGIFKGFLSGYFGILREIFGIYKDFLGLVGIFPKKVYGIFSELPLGGLDNEFMVRSFRRNFVICYKFFFHKKPIYKKLDPPRPPKN